MITNGNNQNEARRGAKSSKAIYITGYKIIYLKNKTQHEETVVRSKMKKKDVYEQAEFRKILPVMLLMIPIFDRSCTVFAIALV